MKEIWKMIPGYEGYYEVSSLGRVRSIARVVFSRKCARCRAYYKGVPARIVIASIGNNGRPFLSLSKKNVVVNRTVSQLVLEAFVGPKQKGLVCCHNNGNPLDNRLENLRWDTYKGNEKDKILHGTSLHGERNHAAKLTYKIAKKIRERKLLGDSVRVLADNFGVHRKTIYSIITGETWQDPKTAITKAEFREKVRKTRAGRDAFVLEVNK